MSLSRSGPHRRSRPSGAGRGGFSLSEDPGDGADPRHQRPAIWAEGRQAPAFAPRAFAEAGLLLAREDAGTGLAGLAGWSRTRAARLRTRDWRLEARLGRLGRLLPTAPGTAAALSAIATASETARQLLYGGSAPPPPAPPMPDTAARLTAEAARQLARQGAGDQARAARKPPPAPEPRPARDRPLPEDDPDIAAIRALLRDAPTEPQMKNPADPKAAFSPAHWESPPEAAPAGAAAGSPVLRRVMDWGIVRVLAGSALVFATPIGYGRALYRHLDGADLREIVADYHRQRIN